MTSVKNFDEPGRKSQLKIDDWPLQIMSDLRRGIVAEERLIHAIMEFYHQIVKEKVQLMILSFDHHSCGSIS